MSEKDMEAKLKLLKTTWEKDCKNHPHLLVAYNIFEQGLKEYGVALYVGLLLYMKFPTDKTMEEVKDHWGNIITYLGLPTLPILNDKE